MYLTLFGFPSTAAHLKIFSLNGLISSSLYEEFLIFHGAGARFSTIGRGSDTKSAKPLADFSPARIASGLILSRGRSKARAETLKATSQVCGCPSGKNSYAHYFH